jgi:pheromone shutdown protein TraB
MPDIRNADVDARNFSEDTIAVLGAAARLYQSDRLAPALREFQATLDELGPDATQNAIRDLIDNRNAHLLTEIRAGLNDYQRIIVPWGALHLPGIEAAILDWGFEQTASRQHRITAYQTIFAALLSRDEPR